MAVKILCIAGPTASGKSSRAVEIASGDFVNPQLIGGFTKSPNGIGEIISVDSRQVYRGLDIGTEKITVEEMRGIPHHLIDIRDMNETYSAGDFVADASRLIKEISERGKLPILVGGTHFYFDALLRPFAEVDVNPAFRAEVERLNTDELFTRVREQDPRRAAELDPKNRRRLIRALEIIASLGSVPPRNEDIGCPNIYSEFRTSDVQTYNVEWIVIDPPKEELCVRIDARLRQALERGLVDEVRWVREQVDDERLNELGLEYKIIGEFLRGERTENSLLPSLSTKLWQYARHQKAWIRKLGCETPK